jgi:hypothetical protein
MRIKIVDEPVRQNVELFLEILRRTKKKQISQPLPQEKVFNAWLNRTTGQLFFADIREGSTVIGKKDWRPISFSYQYAPENGEIQFLVQDADAKKLAFDREDIEPLAMRILQDTMKIFNQICQQLKGPSDLDTKIAVLSKLTIESEVSHVDRNIIFDAWHPADRMGAEDLLKDKPAGTYLFRKDEFAEILEKQLELSLGKKVKCFTLTFSGEDRKISDYTMVHVDGKWQIYNDDPSLEQKMFVDLKEIIADHKDELKYPFYH